MSGIEVTAKGPLMRGDAPPIVRQTAHDIVEELVDLGMTRLNLMLHPRPAGVYLSVEQAQKGKASTGHYRRSLHQEVQETMGIISDGNVVYSSWLEGVSARNDATRFKGYRSFRTTAQWIQQQAQKVAEKHLAKLAEKLNS